MALNQTSNSSTVRGSTNRPPCTSCKQPTKTNTDYINLVNTILANPNNNLLPDNPLYQLALTQFNASAQKGSTLRLEVPKGFCGYIDPTTGQLRVTPDPNTTLLRPGEILVPQSTLTQPVSCPPIVRYPKDQCLEVGLPGSVEYENCQANSVEENNNLSGIDWVGPYDEIEQPENSFRPDQIPELMEALSTALAAYMAGEGTDCEGQPVAASGHGPVYSTSGATAAAAPRVNCDNSRGKVKIVLPNELNGKVINVVFFGSVNETLPLYSGWEEGCRQRYYSAMAPGSYTDITVRWDTTEGDYYYYIGAAHDIG